MRTTILLLAALLLASPAYAEDAGATMAALQGEKTECRYLLGLCSDLYDAGSESEAALARSDTGAFNRALTENARLARQVRDAARVLKAKYAKPPACFAKCPNLTPGGEYVRVPRKIPG